MPRADDQHISDQAKVIDGVTETQINDELLTLREETGIDIVIYSQTKSPVGNRRDARREAAALLEEWDVGDGSGLGAVLFWNVNDDATATRTGVALTEAWTTDELTEIDNDVNAAERSLLEDGAFVDALRVAKNTLEDQLITQGTPTVTPTPRSTTGRLELVCEQRRQPADRRARAHAGPALRGADPHGRGL